MGTDESGCSERRSEARLTGARTGEELRSQPVDWTAKGTALEDGNEERKVRKIS